MTLIYTPKGRSTPPSPLSSPLTRYRTPVRERSASSLYSSHRNSGLSFCLDIDQGFRSLFGSHASTKQRRIQCRDVYLKTEQSLRPSWKTIRVISVASQQRSCYLALVQNRRNQSFQWYLDMVGAFEQKRGTNGGPFFGSGKRFDFVNLLNLGYISITRVLWKLRKWFCGCVKLLERIIDG